MEKVAGLAIERLPLKSVIPNARNPRRHPPEQLQKLEQSIENFGYTKGSMVVVKRGSQYVLLAGHGIYESLRSQGYTEADFIVSELPEGKDAAFMIADNKIAEESTWDIPLLSALTAELVEMDIDLEETGFELHELEELTHEDNQVTEDDPPEVSEEEPITHVGDLWTLGKHRVLCGDSTRKEDVEWVMGGEKAVLMATDPPYGCNAGNIGYTAQRDDIEAISKDDLEGHEMQEFLETVFRAIMPSLTDNCAWYLWHPMLTQGYFAAAAAAAAADLIIHRQIIWKKEMFIFGRGDYHWRHELCFYGWRQGYRPEFYGPRNQDTIWEIDWGEKRSEVGHPTAKPLEVFAIPMRNHTVHGEICLDPFLGSGSQLIAADQLDRICYGIEIEPKYCDVIVKRYINHVGTTENVYVERGGKRLHWDEVRD